MDESYCYEERMNHMGKDLNGKELGKGIIQRKDKKYQARFVDRFGKRNTVYGKTLKEVKNNLAYAKAEKDEEIIKKVMALYEKLDLNEEDMSEMKEIEFSKLFFYCCIMKLTHHYLLKANLY